MLLVLSLVLNKFDAMSSAASALSTFYDQGFDIGQPLVVTDIYSVLKSVSSVLDVVSVDVYIKDGAKYSDAGIDILKIKSADGRFVTPPSDTVFEIKFPNTDIVGTIK